MLKKGLLAILLLIFSFTATAQNEEEQNLLQMPQIEANDNPLENAYSFLFTFLRFQNRAMPYTWQQFRVNGVELNSLSTGRTPYGSIGSLYNAATHTQNNSNLFFDYSSPLSSLGGTRAITIDPQDSQSSGYAIGAVSSRTYSYRLSAGYRLNTSERNGWALIADGSRRWGRSLLVDGVWSDNWGATIAASKNIGKTGRGGTLQLTAIFNPTHRAKAQGTTNEAYQLAGTNLYNPAWGMQNGAQRSANVQKTIEPIIIANHNIELGKNITLSSAIATRFGESLYTALNWQGAPNPRPDYYQYMPSYHSNESIARLITQLWQSDVNTRQINFEGLYKANSMSNNGRANYIIEDRVSQPLFISAQSRITTKNFSISLLGAYQSERNFKRLNSMLGGGYWLDIDSFVEQDDDIKDLVQNNLRDPNRHIKEGDRFGYDYRIDNYKAELEGAYTKKWGNFRLTAAASAALLSTQRVGYYEKENFPTGYSYGASQGTLGIDYRARLECKYSLGSRLSAGVAIGFDSRSPRSDELFISPRYRNAFTPYIENTTILSAEAKVNYQSSNLRLGASVYSYSQNGLSTVKNLYDDIQSEYVHYVTRGIMTSRTGAEFWGEILLAEPLWLSFVGIWQNNIYSNNPTGTTYKESTGALLTNNETLYYKDKHLGGSPEKLGALTLSYQPYGWTIRLTAIVFEGSYESLSPLRHTQRAISRANSEQKMNAMLVQQKSDWGVSVDLFGGYTFRFERGNRLGIYGGIGNLTCNRNIVSYSYQSDRFFRDGWYLTPQPSRYYYALPLNFFLNISYRF